MYDFPYNQGFQKEQDKGEKEFICVLDRMPGIWSAPEKQYC